MTEFLYCNPAKINPKTKEDVRSAELAKIASLKAAGKNVIGLEITVPELAAACTANIDPQHSEGKTAVSCAKEIAQNASELLNKYKNSDVVFITNRFDLDSVASYILADRYLSGKPVSYTPNIAAVNAHDTFQQAAWNGSKPIEKAFDAQNKTAALASSIKVFALTPDNLKNVADYLDTGNVPENIMETYRKTQQNIIDKVNNGEIEVSVAGGIAHVKTTLPCATNVGYAYAPVVIAENPAMKLGAAGTPFRKVSICQHEEGYVDMNKLKETLSTKEEGWGGSPTFIGSKQGENCTINFSDIQKAVYANLTPEYKKNITNTVLNANQGLEI